MNYIPLNRMLGPTQFMIPPPYFPHNTIFHPLIRPQNISLPIYNTYQTHPNQPKDINLDLNEWLQKWEQKQDKSNQITVKQFKYILNQLFNYLEQLNILINTLEASINNASINNDGCDSFLPKCIEYNLQYNVIKDAINSKLDIVKDENLIKYIKNVINVRKFKRAKKRYNKKRHNKI